jgi:hypothetical protein
LAAIDDPEVTLAEVAAVIARAADLATGQPLDHVVRSCAIASLFAEHLELSEDDRAVIYWVSLLTISGCTAVSFELSRLFGDDIDIRGGGYELGPSTIVQAWFLLRRAGGDASLVTKHGRVRASSGRSFGRSSTRSSRIAPSTPGSQSGWDSQPRSATR